MSAQHDSDNGYSLLYNNYAAETSSVQKTSRSVNFASSSANSKERLALWMKRFNIGYVHANGDKRMTAPMGPKGSASPAFIQIERHGDVAIIVPNADVEAMQWDLIEQAADIVLQPLKKEPASGVIVDLSQVAYFGSVFLSLLLRCHKLVKQQGSEMVLCGASERAKELLKLTALDTLWAIYQDREEALDALVA